MDTLRIKDSNQSKKILEAAFKCISVKGYANVSMRDIADEAGVVLSQLSYYYRNKEGLFREIAKNITEKYLGEIDIILKKGKSEEEKIFGLIKYFQETLKNNPQLFRVLYDLTSMSIWSKPIKKLLSNFYSRASELIQNNVMDRLIKREKFKFYSPSELSKILLGALYGTSVQFIMQENEEEISDSTFNELITMFS
ncbi:TetR/AcrR family transcriptional regulator [Clostridium felsineum]|uniref:HTH-type transcriptional regulator BetI n=1 Tax=Clostridium felsineum TaxID=36839 RepID=A0A1S8L0R6_9CLOT|nr:TetR/AcrR family transcriptional regulator [Clostridium felsineum]MCR3757877.1 TetR/AcrR family transcriptional regulator [Clostridium felsineum]URZ00868.1 HTH-type transcriptional regulator BetI [Clostridium felsineum]URZ06386.1 HTH-type transcriptional regulator BetI [Clostridium felsineum]URZ11421.1 HTH-type transcriptional regulator BetI [Clostridium felsineum]URZ16082.1 HTH-type transcriptional regulator BetI [Clostridium felsineum DSM 794]